MIPSAKTILKKQKQKQNRQNTRTNGKSKAIQTKSHKEAYTYTPTKREKENIYIYIVASKVHHLNFGMSRCLFRYSTNASTSSWLWRFNLLLLRLLGEISLSLLCSHSSRGSALDLDPPLRVGRLRASVPLPDRMGLKEQLLRGLWLTQAGGREGYGGGGASLPWQRRRDVAPAWGAPCVLPGKLSLDHGTLAVAGCTGSREGRCGEWPVLAHKLLGGGSSSLSVSRPSLVSALIATARASLWSSFRRRSESPLLARRETKRQEKVSYLFGSCRLFPGLLPGQLWCTNPFRLCSRRQPQSSPCDPTEARASAPSPAHPGWGADKPFGLVSAAWHRASMRESLRFALHTPVAALSSVAPKLPPSATHSLHPRRGS